jgi:hypothetical protein
VNFTVDERVQCYGAVKTSERQPISTGRFPISHVSANRQCRQSRQEDSSQRTQLQPPPSRSSDCDQGRRPMDPLRMGPSTVVDNDVESFDEESGEGGKRMGAMPKMQRAKPR